jgi:hypothetical protein
MNSESNSCRYELNMIHHSLLNLTVNIMAPQISTLFSMTLSRNALSVSHKGAKQKPSSFCRFFYAAWRLRASLTKHNLQLEIIKEPQVFYFILFYFLFHFIKTTKYSNLQIIFTLMQVYWDHLTFDTKTTIYQQQ